MRWRTSAMHRGRATRQQRSRRWRASFICRPGGGAARALFEACGGDRLVLRREIEKLALYLDATAETPATFDLADLAAVGADLNDAELFELGGVITRGDAAATDIQLTRLAPMGGIALLRAVLRRFWLLLDLRAAVDGGASPSSAVDGARPPVFWKDKEALAAELGHWRTPMLRAALARLLATEARDQAQRQRRRCARDAGASRPRDAGTAALTAHIDAAAGHPHLERVEAVAQPDLAREARGPRHPPREIEHVLLVGARARGSLAKSSAATTTWHVEHAIAPSHVPSSGWSLACARSSKRVPAGASASTVVRPSALTNRTLVMPPPAAARRRH